MGNTTSSDPELVQLKRRFSAEEIEELQHLFLSLAAQSRSGGNHVIASVFQAYFGLHGTLGSRLFELIARGDDDGTLTFEEFIKAKAVVDKGSDEELDKFAYAVSDILRTGTVTKLEAHEVVSSALLTVFGSEGACLSDDVLSAFVNSAKFSGPPTSLGLAPSCPRCEPDHSGATQSNEESNASAASSQDRLGSDDSGTPDVSSLEISHGERVDASGTPAASADGDASAKTTEKHPGPVERIREPQESRESLHTHTQSERASGFRERSAQDSDILPQQDDISNHSGMGQRGGHKSGQMRRSLSLASGGKQPVHDMCKRCDKVPSMTERDFKEWQERVPSLRRFLRSLLAPPTVARSLSGRSAPLLEWPMAASKERTSSSQLQADTPLKKKKKGRFLMSEELAWHISGMLNDKEAEGPWRLVYSSSLHGLSFSTFMGKTADTPLPSTVIVRDKQGAVFGAVFSQPLQRKSVFFGDMKTFLFSFLPTAAVYKPSGLNQNIQWCATGFTSESIPNGVGFGGQIGHYGLFLDSSFDKGHSWPCVTFHSPSLSSEPHFDVDTVECWSIGQPEEEDESSATSGKKPQLKGTVLDRFKEEKALLGFSGVATASDNLSREDAPDPT